MTPEIDEAEAQVQRFFDAVLSLRTTDECRALFDTVLSATEAERVPVRWWIARMLAEGKATNKEIAAALGVSTTTVSSVNARLKRTHAALRATLNRLS